ncbi:replication initiator protein [Orenia metallireducens]|jgi:plasmid replication initiation protein|uniref:Initiator Replication protein n=1 Tax=Orenia metallireducens TaxID=1413210 RepID=A0A285IDE7_9FIRM|nr:replication initiation protein [Orenia metallireducens]PRX19640.1 replication initiator protein [Orenia metallireducens]SNY45953.1 Initiator Replication protein [Orenia metallireducens]
MANDLIVKHNKVIESKYNMTSTEAKIIAKLTCLIEKNDEDFKEHTFRSRDLLEELGLGENNYVALKESIRKLITREIEIHQPDKRELITTFLSSCVYDNINSTITLSYDPKLKPYFLQLKNNFTKYYLENILELKSFYSIRIYELLKQYERIKERKITITDLREILDVKDKYKLYADFKRRILLQAQDEINQKTDLEVDFEEIKTGRKVTGIKFIIHKKELPERELEFKEFPKESYSPEVLELFQLLPPKEQVEAHKRELSKLLKEHSYDYLKADIEYAKQFEVKNFLGFLKSSCQRGHYSTAEVEKKERKEDLARQREAEEQRKQELEKKIKQKAEEKARERYSKLSEQELEEYGSKYESLPKMLKERITREDFVIGALEEELEEELRELTEMMF